MRDYPVRKYPWVRYAQHGRSKPHVPFAPAELRNAPSVLAEAIKRRRIRALRFPDGRLEPSTVNYNPETRRCDIWLRWVPNE